MKNTIIGCAVVALLLAIAGAIAFWYLFVRELPVLDAALAVPGEVTTNAEITLVVTATNSHTDPLTLDSIDIDETFLGGFQVVSIDPAPTDTMSIFGMRSWSFDKEVAPGQNIVVTYTLKAVQEGHFTGDVSVYNPNQDCNTVMADVVVKAAPN